MSAPVFYELPADLIRVGMSTDDAQDVIGVTHDSTGQTYVTVYTPSDDADEDSARQSAPETRVYRTDSIITMATFSDTAVDRSRHKLARIAR